MAVFLDVQAHKGHLSGSLLDLQGIYVLPERGHHVCGAGRFKYASNPEFGISSLLGQAEDYLLNVHLPLAC